MALRIPASRLLFAVVCALWLPVVAAAQFPPPLPPEKTVEVLGQHIRYVEAGQGPALIFVHGLGSSSASWTFNIGPASEKFHVYALDQIGFGHSDKPLIDYRIETFVEFLQGFMQALNIPKAALVGNSLGGWIAVDFTAQHPEMVDKLVLVDAAGLTPEGPRSPTVDLNPSSLVGMRAILEAVFYNKQIISDQLVRQAFEEHLKNGDGYTTARLLDTLFRGNQYEDQKLASIRVATLAIWGRDDRLTPISVGERYQKAIAGAKMVVFDQCGHVPQMEQASRFNKALLDFLGQ